MAGKILVPQFNSTGEKASDFEVTVVLPKVQPDLVTQACNIYLNNLRQGNANTKDKGDVRGGGRKPWKQKGTGRARQGSTRSPQWRHGGIAHGPHTSEHRQELPVAMARKALKMALNDRLSSGCLFVIENPEGKKAFKSKEVAAILSKIVPSGQLSLVLSTANHALARGARNLAGVTLLTVDNLHTYDVVAAKSLVIDHSAAERLFKKA